LSSCQQYYRSWYVVSIAMRVLNHVCPFQRWSVFQLFINKLVGLRTWLFLFNLWLRGNCYH
jgi:hypothetical protein